MSLTEQVRQAVGASGREQAEICRDLRISPSTLSRFVTGQRGLTLPVLDRLADLLGLRLVAPGGTRARTPRAARRPPARPAQRRRG